MDARSPSPLMASAAERDRPGKSLHDETECAA